LTNPLELGCPGFHEVSPSLPHITLTLICYIKASTPFECKYQIVPITLLVFIDVGEYSVMGDDVVTPSNPPIGPIEEEELEKTPFGVNVSQ
jgi:hypothetical protein